MQKQTSNDEVDSMDLELDGHIYIVERDKNKKVLSRIELNGELILQLILTTISDAIDGYISPE